MIQDLHMTGIIILLCGAAAWAAPSGLDPYIGFVYPAGGRQGTTFKVILRGQRLKTVDSAYISGSGVRASVIDYESGSGPLNAVQKEELRRRIQELVPLRMRTKVETKGTAAKPADAPAVVLPDLPELRNLDQLTPMQLRRVAEKFLNNAKRPKPPIAERITLEVTVDPNAAPGDRELRLHTPAGLTNPLVFQIGQIPEVNEPDTSDDNAPEPTPSQPPVVFNGRIMPGEVDHFPIQLRAGQKIIVAVQARKLIPYLADAVPGWFQAVAAVRDDMGKELAYQDDCGFDPDPALVFQAPKDGKYTIEIRDAIYRGREDFVYRVDVIDESLARSIFPLGSRGGVPIGSAGINKELCAQMALDYFGCAADPLPISREIEPNNTGKTSMGIKLPIIISGAISAPGDKDVFGFDGHAGDQIVAEVYARRMGSSLDSLLRLIDTTGRVIAWNDDYEDPEYGLLTHQADSYLSARLPATGHYFVQLSDAQGHGSPAYNYYLRIGAPRPDFALISSPSALNVAAGRSIALTVNAVRKDGWNGDIEVVLKDAPDGFSLSGAIIPQGRSQVRMTLTAPRGRFTDPIALQLEGRALINGKTVTHPVAPADNMMQAFAYYHLVQSKQMLVSVARGYLASPSLNMTSDRLNIPAGGTAQVTFQVRPAPSATAHLELIDPPAGITLQDVKTTSRGYTLTLKADEKHTGYADNLIIEAFTEVAARTAKGTSGQKQRVSLGVLPAVPFEIVRKGSSQL